VDRAVITVPAYFNDARASHGDAGRSQDSISALVNETDRAAWPTACTKEAWPVAVYDFGGGTFEFRCSS